MTAVVMQGVIYIFQCPKGRVYAGWRGVSPEALKAWPNRGRGALPDGYKGSGRAWLRVARKHKDALNWRILARVDGTQADVDRLERRAIHLARLIFGRRCVNIADGGLGQTPEGARRMWTDPGYVAKVAATNARPEVKAKKRAAQLEAQNRPDVRAKKSATDARPEVKARQSRAQVVAHSRPEVKARHAAANACPEVKAKRSRAQRAWANKPEVKAQLSRAAQIGHRKRRARKALAPFTISPAVSLPGATVWTYRPGSPLGINGPSTTTNRRSGATQLKV